MSGINVAILRAIANANAANTAIYVSPAEGMDLVKHQPPLITVDGSNKDPNDANKIAAHITDDGAKYLDSVNGETAKPSAHFAVQSGGLELPKITRQGGFGGGAPTKYPFETMNVGDFFFVANTDVAKGDAVKTMGSAAGSANQRFAEDIVINGEIQTHQVTRAKRGPDHKSVKGPDGKNVMETVTVNKKRFTKKFVVRPVKAGVKYGEWTAPADGAVVARVALPAVEAA
jgi:hypothetical protein